MSSRLVAVALAAALVLAACGGSDGDDSPLEPSTTTTEADRSAVMNVELDAAVRYAGFRLTLAEAIHTETLVVVSGRAENLGSTSSQPPTNLTLDLGRASVELDSFESDITSVPGDSIGEVVYAFTVPDDADITDAVLYIGGADFARAAVPFGEVGELVTNEPIAVDLTGEVIAGATTFTLEGGEVRFDVPDDHEPAEAGKAFLTIDFTVTNNSDFAGGYAFVPADLRLKTPSGISLAPDKSPIELLAPLSSTPDLFVRWTIDTDVEGAYTFIGLRNVGMDSQAEGVLTFELPALG